MVLPGKLGGRVGRRRDSSRSAACGRRFVVPGVPRRRRALPPPRTARCAREGHRGRPPQPPEPSRPIRAPRPRRLETWRVLNPPHSRPAPLWLLDRPLERPRHRRSHRPSWSDVRAERPRRRTPSNRWRPQGRAASCGRTPGCPEWASWPQGWRAPRVGWSLHRWPRWPCGSEDRPGRRCAGGTDRGRASGGSAGAGGQPWGAGAGGQPWGIGAAGQPWGAGAAGQPWRAAGRRTRGGGGTAAGGARRAAGDGATRCIRGRG